MAFDELNMTCLRAPVGLDDVFDCPPADGAARVGHLLELEAAGVAQTHVAAGVEDRVHGVLVADGALVAPRAGGEGGRLRVAGEGRARGCAWRREEREHETRESREKKGRFLL